MTCRLAASRDADSACVMDKCCTYMAQRLCIRTQGKVSTVRVLAGVLELPGCLRIPGAYIQIVTPGPYPRDPDPGDPRGRLQRALCGTRLTKGNLSQRSSD